MDVRVVTSAGVATRPASADEVADANARAAAADASAVTDWRAQATLSRLEMGVALRTAGILTHAERMELMRGEIPTPLQAFIDLLPEDAREFAEAATAAGQPFERSSPMWAAVAAAETGPTETDIDALFGWT